MFTIQQTKIALSPDDDIRHIVRCDCKTGACSSYNFETLAHGHYKIKRQRSHGEGTSHNDANDDGQSQRKQQRTVEAA